MLKKKAVIFAVTVLLVISMSVNVFAAMGNPGGIISPNYLYTSRVYKILYYFFLSKSYCPSLIGSGHMRSSSSMNVLNSSNWSGYRMMEIPPALRILRWL